MKTLAILLLLATPAVAQTRVADQWGRTLGWTYQRQNMIIYQEDKSRSDWFETPWEENARLRQEVYQKQKAASDAAFRRAWGHD